MPTAGRKGSRSTCAVCGLSKRYVFNRAAREGRYDVIATGHNPDDEAATLLGNTLVVEHGLHRAPVARAARGGRIRAQGQAAVPALGAGDRGLRVLAGDRLRGGGVPARRRQHAARYKQAMNQLEATSPGTKAQFFLGYLDRAAPLFATQDEVQLVACESCGQPTTGRFCAFCRARAQVLGERLEGPGDERASQGGRPTIVRPRRRCPTRSRP